MFISLINILRPHMTIINAYEIHAKVYFKNERLQSVIRMIVGSPLGSQLCGITWEGVGYKRLTGDLQRRENSSWTDRKLPSLVVFLRLPMFIYNNIPLRTLMTYFMYNLSGLRA